MDSDVTTDPLLEELIERAGSTIMRRLFFFFLYPVKAFGLLWVN